MIVCTSAVVSVPAVVAGCGGGDKAKPVRKDGDFQAKFDQAAAKLDLSKQGRELNGEKKPGEELSDDEKKQVEKLKQRDQEVRRQGQRTRLLGDP